MRAAIYARFSSDLQSQNSIEDQARICRARAEKEDWTVAGVFTDFGISGTTHLRPGFQNLLEAARQRRFEVVLAEALDRLSRDQEHIAGLYKQLCFLGIRLITLAEGEISELHVGLKGTMNALFIKDLAAKTRRGMEGRVRQGRSGGGKCYGYDVVRETDAQGEPVRGGRAIDPAEAEVVRRIFAHFAAGMSPKQIARRLNAEGVPGPNGRAWGDTTIRGHYKRRTGILYNELYAGRLIWNRMRFVKDPVSGKRLSRPNPESEWIIEDVPDLRIIDESLWQQVQSRLAAIRCSPAATKIRESAFWQRRRARHLLTGLVHCGSCGQPMAAVGRDYLACNGARVRGTCSQRPGVRRTVVEALILEALKERLMAPELVKEFIAAFQVEINAERSQADARRKVLERDLAEVRRRLDGLVDAIAEGLRGATVQQKLEALEQRQADLRLQLASAPSALPLLHPNIAELYRRQVEALHEALADPDTQAEALEIIRGLIERVVVRAGSDGPDIELIGDIAALVGLASGNKKAALEGAAVRETLTRSAKVVAGAGFEPTTFRL